MKDKVTTRHNISDVFQELELELSTNEILLLTTTNPVNHKWSMAKLFRMWMVPTAVHMRNTGWTMPLGYKNGKPYGKRLFDSNDSYELFTAFHGGVDEDEKRLSWTKKGRDGMRPATNGERFDMLRKHENWALEKDVILMKPRDSEYWKMEEEQNK